MKKVAGPWLYYNLTNEPKGSGELKIRVSYFSMRNPYMKFQKPSNNAWFIRYGWHASDFILIFSKGHNSSKGDNLEKKIPEDHILVLYRSPEC